MAEYDRGVIEEYAQKLYDRIGWMIVTTILVYAGAAFLATLAWIKFAEFAASGRVEQVEAPLTWYILAAAVGAVIGALRGNSKAFDLKMEAQRALCLLQIERNTSGKNSEPDGAISRRGEGSERADAGLSAGEKDWDVAPAEANGTDPKEGR